MKGKKRPDGYNNKTKVPSQSNKYPGETALQALSHEELVSRYLQLRDETLRLGEQNENLKQFESQFQLLADNSPVTILIQNRELIYTLVVNSAQLMPAENILGKTDGDLLSPAEAARVIEIKKKLLQNGQSYLDEITRKSDSIPHSFEVMYKALKDTSGNIIGIATYIKDITDQKESEQELSRQLNGEKLLAEITSQFLLTEVAHSEKQIPIALQKVAEYLQADIGFIRFIDSQSNTIHKGYDWSKPSIAIKDFESFQISVDQFKLTLDRLASNQPIFVPELHLIPAEAESEKQFLKKTGMASLALLPIFIGGSFSGYIGFGARESHPFWSEREKGLLDLFRSIIVNVLEWQERERNFNESQTLYHRVLELSPNAIYLIQEKNLLYTNPAGALLMGFTNPDEIIGKPFEDIMPANLVQDFRNRYRQNLQENKPFLAEIPINLINQVKVEYEFSSLPLIVQGKKSFLTEGVDITRRKLIEKEIEGNRRFLNDILDITPLATYVFDHQEDRLTYFNRATAKIFGLNAERLWSLNSSQMQKMFHPYDLKLIRAMFSKLEDLPIGQVIEGEFRWVRPDGDILSLHSFHTVISRTRDGKAHQSLSILQNITDVRKSQLELKYSEDLYRSVVENMPGVVYRALCDDLFTTVFLSDYYTKLTSIDKNDIINNRVASWIDQVHPDDREKLAAEIKEAIANSRPFEIEYRIKNASGNYIWVVDNGCIIYDDSRQPRFVSGIVTDISARKRDFESMQKLSQDNLRLLAQARHDSETKTLLLNEVNHRVKNNIASIIGLIELERDREINSTSDFQIALDSIKTRITGLATVHDILSSNQWSPVRIEVFVRKIVENAAASSPIGRKVAISIHSQERNLWINARQATALALILNELTTNTIRHAFTDREDGTITITIRRESKTTNVVRIRYADDGPGWPEDVISGEGGNVGMQVIRLSAISPLYGDLKLENHNGAVAVITFNLVAQRDLFKSTDQPETT